jgi:chromosome segregation ATPase
MQQQNQKCAAEARWQTAQRRLSDEQEALKMWNEQIAHVRADWTMSQQAVESLQSQWQSVSQVAKAQQARRQQTAAAVADLRVHLVHNACVCLFFLLDFVVNI